ncbi:MAG: class I SAM-dependent methyltransferase [Candidatus Bipolaricaulia bacterium]
MTEFFDARATEYDDHMRDTVEEFDRFYAAIASALPASDAPLAILDLGIGTGLELPALLARLPNARVTGIDLSSRMLAELRHKHPERAEQVRILRGSFLDVDFGRGVYDAVLSAMALHHHPFDEKVALYRRVHSALRPGGPFINGDYIVSADEAARLMAEYKAAIRRLGGAPRSPIHLDIPFTVEDEVRALRTAGFLAIDVVRRAARSAVIRAA